MKMQSNASGGKSDHSSRCTFRFDHPAAPADRVPRAELLVDVAGWTLEENLQVSFVALRLTRRRSLLVLARLGDRIASTAGTRCAVLCTGGRTIRHRLLTNLLIDLLTDRLAGLLVNLLTDRLVDLLTHLLAGILAGILAGVLAHLLAILLTDLLVILLTILLVNPRCCTENEKDT